jgi:hypothetical protein
MPSHIYYQRCQCEVRGGDVVALHIRDRTNRTHRMINGEFHAQDNDLHKFHAQFHEHNHRHA